LDCARRLQGTPRLTRRGGIPDVELNIALKIAFGIAIV
jgi:hypothetical protein